MAAETNFDALRENLRAELEAAQKRMAALEKAYAALSPPDTRTAGKYARMRVWLAVREYLRTVGGKAAITDILDELQRGGAPLGKYPLRTLKIALNSPYMRQTFKVEAIGNDDVVTLRRDRDDSGRDGHDPHRPRPSPGGTRRRKS